MMKKVLLALSLLAANSAVAVNVTPSDALATTSTNSNLSELAQINSAFGTTFTDLTLLYKGDQGGGESGSATSVYNYTITASPNNDYDEFTITYESGTPAVCPTCVLIVKDGNNDPSQYLIDLGSWDGMETIYGSGFWTGTNGAISNVALWRGDGPNQGCVDCGVVPLPAAAWLFGSGLLGLAGVARRRKIAS